MTDIKFEILKALYNVSSNTLSYVEILNLVPGGNTVRKALEDLETAYEKPLIRKCVGQRAYKLTPYGRLAYENECYKQTNKSSKTQNHPENSSRKGDLLAYLREHLPLFANLVIKIIDFFHKK